jgi:DHA2 family multidrug resistance protein-like MFS transporter
MASALLSAVSSALLIGGINGLGHGQAIPMIVLELAGAIVTGYVLVRRQASSSLPLLPVDLFRRPVFALSVTTSVCTFVALGIIFVTLPFYFQDVLGRSQVATGLLMTPWPTTVALVAPIAGRLADRYSAGTLCGIGLGVLTSGFLLLAALPAQPQAADIVWRMMICGFGFGLFGSPNNRAIIASAPRERSGGSGAIQSADRLLARSNRRRRPCRPDLRLCRPVGRKRTDFCDLARRWVCGARRHAERPPAPQHIVRPRPLQRAAPTTGDKRQTEPLSE